jgi:hypothetical protein
MNPGGTAAAEDCRLKAAFGTDLLLAALLTDPSILTAGSESVTAAAVAAAAGGERKSV